MLLYVWIALAAGGAAVLASLAFAISRGLRTWRTFRRFRRRSFEALEEQSRRIAGIERRVDGAAASAERLMRAQAELARSLAEARLLSDAFAEVRATVARVTGFAAGK